jgi:hypothetical protein
MNARIRVAMQYVPSVDKGMHESRTEWHEQLRMNHDNSETQPVTVAARSKV